MGLTDAVLVVQPATERVWKLDGASVVRRGGGRWSGITVFGTQLYGTPSGERQVLAVDAAKRQRLRGLDTAALEGEARGMWQDIAALGTHLFASPSSKVKGVLVVHPAKQQVSVLRSATVATNALNW